MLYPSIDSLMDKLDSKYTLVTVSAKRARELRDNLDKKLKVSKPVSKKLVGMALEEIEGEHLSFKRNEEE